MKSALRTFGLAVAFMLVGTPAIATVLTPAQEAIVKAAILADSYLAGQSQNADGDSEIARQMNMIASPAFTVWKTKVLTTKVGDNIVATELASLSTTNLTRLQTIVMLSEDGVNPSLADRRAFFDDIFSGPSGAGTRAKLLALWKRPATRLEGLLSTGTGTDAAPATLTFEGTISYQDIGYARRCVNYPDGTRICF